MSSDFNPLLWFVCKICRQAFPDTEKLKYHKIRKHAEACKNVKCIVFEERLFDNQWIPSDNYFPESNSEFTNENLIEVAPLTSECGCHSISAVPAGTQTESHQEPLNHKTNPYVLVKRMTLTELNAARNRSLENPIFQPGCCSEERKRTIKCFNNEDFQSQKQTKEYFSHQENHHDPEQDLLDGQNIILVLPPELVQNLVTQTEELNTLALPEPVEFSSTDPLSSISCDPLSCLKVIENEQNSEEKRLREAISFPLLEGEIHVELLSVTKELQSSTEHPDPANQLLPKTKNHNKPHLSAEEQTRNSAKKPSKPIQSPYVLVKRLTCGELDTAVTQNLEKIITKSDPRCKERKRVRDDNKLSPTKNKSTLQHQNQEQDFLMGGNHSVCNPELFHEIVASKAERDRDVFPEHEQFSSISTLSDSLTNAPPDIKYVANKQNTEENNEQLPTGMQTLEYKEQHIGGFESSVGKKIWCSRSDPNTADTTTLALPALFDFGNLSRADGNDDNRNHSESNNAEQIPMISDVYSQAPVAEDICPSDSECFEMENPISPEFFDEVELVEELYLPTSVVSEISVADDDIQLNQMTATIDAQLEGEPLLNEELDENTVCVTSSACPIPFSAHTTINASPEAEPVETSKSGLPRYSTRAKRKKAEINYSESHICSDCKHDFDSFDDLLDHQILCTKQHRVDSVNRKNKNSHRPNLILSSTNSSKCRKVAHSVTDGDSDYAAGEIENMSDSDSENDDNINPVYVPRAKLPKGDISSDALTFTIPQHQKESLLKENAEKINLALLEWLEAQNQARFPDGTKNKIQLWTDTFCTYKDLGPKNYITCRLCETELYNEFQLKNHVANCWLHNQSNHLFCVPCGLGFAYPRTLAKHIQEDKYSVEHNNFRIANGPHTFDTNVDQVGTEKVHQRQPSVNDTDHHPEDPVSGDRNLPLLQWLQLQKKNPNNVLALEPDPLKSDRNSTTPHFAISESSPIKCKLCLQLLTSDVLLRNHVATCWSQNKGKHRYCVPCNKYYNSVFCLRQHQRTCKHKNALYQKEKQKPSWACSVCHKDMKNKQRFNAHQHSLDIFILDKSSGNENSKFQRNADVDITGQQWTMMNLSRWLKKIRKVPHSDGTSNLILIDPEPGSSKGKDSDKIEINEDNPITCRLCLKTFTQVKDVKKHVKMCWFQNTENHCYCVSCDQGFATPIELQEHRTSEHAENIVLFYREADSDQSLVNVDGLDVNSDNPVTCKLCDTELTSTPQVKIHTENCWIHNRPSHVYCTICDRTFKDSTQLRDHNKYRHRNSPGCGSVEDKTEIQTEREKLLPRGEWFKIQQKNKNNIVALEPDLLASEAVTESSPVNCKLCQQHFTTERVLRDHVKTCWKYNNAKHRYCIPCDSVFDRKNDLLKHNTAKHPKYPAMLLSCRKCNQEFLTKSELTKHLESLQEFCRQRQNYKKRVRKVNSVNTATIGSSSSNTMAFLFEWLKRLRQIKNIYGTENVILVDPEPTVDNFEEIDSENPITCRLCQQEFNKPQTLKRHLQDCWTHKKEMHRFCVTCEKVFETPQNLQDHSRIEHSNVARASFICKFCSQEFIDENIFEEHEAAHKDPNFLPFKCTHCSAAFNAKIDLLKHMTALHRGHGKVVVAGHKCKICLKSFTAPNMLNDHIRSVHTGDRPFVCKFPNCSFACSYKGNRQTHYTTKHREEMGLEPLREEFLCPTCGKVFRKHLLLTRHLKIQHTQNKPYNCTHEGCTKAFKVNSQLTEHVRVHTGEKPYVCEECGQAFARLWSFVKHKRSHQGTLNRAQCHLCPRKFLGGWELKQHLKIHQEKNEFKCQFCQVECATASYLKKHEKTHGNERDSHSEDDSQSSAHSDV